MVKMRQYRPDSVVQVGAATDLKIFTGPEEQKPEDTITFEALVQGLVAKLQGEDYARTECHCYGVKLIGATPAHSLFEFKRFNKSGDSYDGGMVLVDMEFVDGKYMFTGMWTW